MKTYINDKIFQALDTKEVAYLLGFIWADGYLSKRCSSVIVECVKEDLEILLPIFLTTGKWNHSFRNRAGRKPQMSIYGASKSIHNILNSSKSSMDLLSKFSNNLKPYFIQGLIDGDGCVYVNKANYLYQFSVASNYDENWDIAEYFTTLGVKNVKVKRRVSKNGNKDSILLFCGKDNMKILLDNVYPNREAFGLQRKFNKLLSINYRDEI